MRNWNVLPMSSYTCYPCPRSIQRGRVGVGVKREMKTEFETNTGGRKGQAALLLSKKAACPDTQPGGIRLAGQAKSQPSPAGMPASSLQGMTSRCVGVSLTHCDKNPPQISRRSQDQMKIIYGTENQVTPEK